MTCRCCLLPLALLAVSCLPYTKHQAPHPTAHSALLRTEKNATLASFDGKAAPEEREFEIAPGQHGIWLRAKQTDCRPMEPGKAALVGGLGGLVGAAIVARGECSKTESGPRHVCFIAEAGHSYVLDLAAYDGVWIAEVNESTKEGMVPARACPAPPPKPTPRLESDAARSDQQGVAFPHDE